MGFLDEFKRLAHPMRMREEDNFGDDFDASPVPSSAGAGTRPRSEPAYSSPVMDEAGGPPEQQGGQYPGCHPAPGGAGQAGAL